ncbi:MAG TPA: PoNe immunity protein domain-containing protein [Cytophagaceae bacterium]|jgi:hypothetical protein
MKQRDRFKHAEYFNDFISTYSSNLSEYLLVLEQPITKDHRLSLLYTVFRTRMELWIARYSAGEVISSLKYSYPEVIQSLENYLREDKNGSINFLGLTDYIQSLWLVSIALLLQLEDEMLKQLINLIGNTGKDALYDRLINIKYPLLPAGDTLIHPKQYQSLYNAINSVDEKRREIFINTFLDEYYSRMQDVYWSGTHELDNGYFGYWLFELAAFSRFLPINDDRYRNNRHYPVDLVDI